MKNLFKKLVQSSKTYITLALAILIVGIAILFISRFNTRLFYFPSKQEIFSSILLAFAPAMGFLGVSKITSDLRFVSKWFHLYMAIFASFGVFLTGFYPIHFGIPQLIFSYYSELTLLYVILSVIIFLIVFFFEYRRINKFYKGYAEEEDERERKNQEAKDSRFKLMDLVLAGFISSNNIPAIMDEKWVSELMSSSEEIIQLQECKDPIEVQDFLKNFQENVPVANQPLLFAIVIHMLAELRKCEVKDICKNYTSSC